MFYNILNKPISCLYVTAITYLLTLNNIPQYGNTLTSSPLQKTCFSEKGTRFEFFRILNNQIEFR